MKDFAKTIVKSPATFIIVVLLLLLTLLVTVRASTVKVTTDTPISGSDIEMTDQTTLE